MSLVRPTLLRSVLRSRLCPAGYLLSVVERVPWVLLLRRLGLRSVLRSVPRWFVLTSSLQFPTDPWLILVTE